MAKLMLKEYKKTHIASPPLLGWSDEDMNESWCDALCEGDKNRRGETPLTFLDWLERYKEEHPVCLPQVVKWSDNLNKAFNSIDAVDSIVDAMRSKQAVADPAEWDELDMAVETCKKALDAMRNQVYEASGK